MSSSLLLMGAPRFSERSKNRSPDRETASLSRRARLAERSEGDQSGDQRIERASEAVEKLATDMAGHCGIGLVLWVRRHQFGGASLPRPLDPADGVSELGEVDRIVVEGHHCGVACRLRAQENAFRQLKIAGAVLVERLSGLCNVGRGVGKVAAVLHEDPSQRAVWGSLPIVKDEAQLKSGKSAGPSEIGNKVGADERGQVLDRPEAPREELHIDGRDDGKHRDREQRQRPQ